MTVVVSYQRLTMYISSVIYHHYSPLLNTSKRQMVWRMTLFDLIHRLYNFTSNISNSIDYVPSVIIVDGLRQCDHNENGINHLWHHYDIILWYYIHHLWHHSRWLQNPAPSVRFHLWHNSTMLVPWWIPQPSPQLYRFVDLPGAKPQCPRGCRSPRAAAGRWRGPVVGRQDSGHARRRQKGHPEMENFWGENVS